MGGEGHMLDMIRRLKEGRDSSSPEEMGRIIRQSEEKKEADDRYFVFGTLIIIGILLLCAVILWAIFIR